MNSSAISKISYTVERGVNAWGVRGAGVLCLRPQINRFALMFWSMPKTRTWFDRRMLASPGLRRKDISCTAHISSVGFFQRRQAFHFKSKRNTFAANRHRLLLSLSFPLAVLVGAAENPRSKRRPAAVFDPLTYHSWGEHWSSRCWRWPCDWSCKRWEPSAAPIR